MMGTRLQVPRTSSATLALDPPTRGPMGRYRQAVALLVEIAAQDGWMPRAKRDTRGSAMTGHTTHLSVFVLASLCAGAAFANGIAAKDGCYGTVDDRKGKSLGRHGVWRRVGCIGNLGRRLSGDGSQRDTLRKASERACLRSQDSVVHRLSPGQCRCKVLLRRRCGRVWIGVKDCSATEFRARTSLPGMDRRVVTA
jgi:hypothetical protein